MKFHIKNNTHRTKAFKVWGGTEDVLPGKERVIDIEGDVSEEFIERMKADGVEMKPAGKADPLDHDGNGKKGGSLPKSGR